MHLPPKADVGPGNIRRTIIPASSVCPSLSTDLEGYIGRRHAATLSHSSTGDNILAALANGLGASLLALVAASTWAAIGSLFRGATAPRDPLALPVALLIGSGVTAGALAVLTRAGIVIPGVAGVWAAGLAVLVARRRVVVEMVSTAIESFSKVLPDRALYWAGAPAAALLWLNAVAPPRDGDSMRYHLAHVRQIIQDGGWQSIADYHYALPFGWTLNYLPFELMHLPQAAQLLNASLLVVMLGSLLALLSERGVGPLWLAVVTALSAHPFVVRTFTGASADGYAIFVVFTVAAILLRADEARPGDAGTFRPHGEERRLLRRVSNHVGRAMYCRPSRRPRAPAKAPEERDLLTAACAAGRGRSETSESN